MSPMLFSFYILRSAKRKATTNTKKTLLLLELFIKPEIPRVNVNGAFQASGCNMISTQQSKFTLTAGETRDKEHPILEHQEQTRAGGSPLLTFPSPWGLAGGP